MNSYDAKNLNSSRIVVLTELEEKLSYRINFVHDQMRRHRIKFNPINGIDIIVVSRTYGTVPVHKYHKGTGDYMSSYPSVLSAHKAVSEAPNNGCISAAATGKRRSAYGYRWSYEKVNKLRK